MENKIDPRQYTPYALNTPSGNFDIFEGVDYFNIVLREFLTGNFHVTGSLKLNGEHVYGPNTTNNITEEGDSHLFGGRNSTVTGDKNVIFNSSSSTIAGEYNTIIGGINNDVSGAYSVAIGNNINISKTGAVVLSDNSFNIHEDNGDGSLSAYFTGGVYIDNHVRINDQFWVTGGDSFFSGFNLVASENFYVGGSGHITGDFNVEGRYFVSGVPMPTIGVLINMSGLILSGQNHLTNSAFLKSGNHVVSGNAQFNANIFLDSGVTFYGAKAADLTATDNYLKLLDFNTGYGSGAYAELKSESSFRIYIDENGYGNGGGLSRSEYFNGFSIWEGANLLMSVNPTGDVYHRGAIRMNPNVTIPTAETAAGIQGQAVWDTGYLYICTGWAAGGNSGWARVALSW